MNDPTLPENRDESEAVLRWEVEWATCSADRWHLGWSYRDFTVRPEAVAFAREVLPQSTNGMVRVTPFLQGRSIPGRMYTSESVFLRRREIP